MQFQVPQFIDTEDKIVGPLSLRQFAFIGVAGLLSAFLYFVAQFWLWIIGSIIVFGLAGAVAFVKIEGRPFANVLLSAFNFYWKPQTYVWQPEHAKVTMKSQKPAITAKKSASSLEELLARTAPKRRHVVMSAKPLISPEAETKEVPKILEAPKEKDKIVPPPADISKPAKTLVQPQPRPQPSKYVIPEEEVAAAAEEESASALVMRASVSAGSALHKIWENIQTGSKSVNKNSDRQFLERKMAERYQIFNRIEGDRGAARRVDYR